MYFIFVFLVSFVLVSLMGCHKEEKILSLDKEIDKIEYIYVDPYSVGLKYHRREYVLVLDGEDNKKFSKELIMKLLDLKEKNRLHVAIPDCDSFEFRVMQGKNKMTLGTPPLYFTHISDDIHCTSNAETALFLLNFFTEKTKQPWQTYFYKSEEQKAKKKEEVFVSSFLKDYFKKHKEEEWESYDIKTSIISKKEAMNLFKNVLLRDNLFLTEETYLKIIVSRPKKDNSLLLGGGCFYFLLDEKTLKLICFFRSR